MKRKTKEKLYMERRISEMNAGMKKAGKEFQPSKYWVKLNEEHLNKLETYGFKNFKRNIVRNYFTAINLHFIEMQTKFLFKQIPTKRILFFLINSILIKKHKYIGLIQSINYNFKTYLLWEYVTRFDKDKVLENIDEPLVGNPPRVYYQHKLISSDLANTAMEYYSIMNVLDSKANNIKIICELGAGYGRTAHFFLSQMKRIKYIIIDIPPALFIAEQYLSQVFPKKRVFKYQEFRSFKDIEGEWNRSDIIFLLSSQIKLIPKGYADLFINISSFHEMRVNQIKYFFSHIERITRDDGFFYLKEWKDSLIPFENIHIKMDDYPISKKWQIIYMREAKIQTAFFETLLKKKE